jgi:hypothetical protein
MASIDHGTAGAPLHLASQRFPLSIFFAPCRDATHHTVALRPVPLRYSTLHNITQRPVMLRAVALRIASLRAATLRSTSSRFAAFRFASQRLLYPIFIAPHISPRIATHRTAPPRVAPHRFATHRLATIESEERNQKCRLSSNSASKASHRSANQSRIFPSLSPVRAMMTGASARGASTFTPISMAKFSFRPVRLKIVFPKPRYLCQFWFPEREKAHTQNTSKLESRASDQSCLESIRVMFNQKRCFCLQTASEVLASEFGKRIRFCINGAAMLS